MKKPQLTKMIGHILAPHGYVFKSGRFTKTSGEMIAVVDFMKMDGAEGIVATLGGGPLSTCYTIPPKNTSHCGIQITASRVARPGICRVFSKLETDIHPSVEQLVAATEELVLWIEHNFLNSQVLRSRILDPNSELRKYGLIMRTLKRWAGLHEDA